MSHVPVMDKEIDNVFAGVLRPVRKALDGTFGRGGHSRNILRDFPKVKLFAFDRDDAAISFGKDNFAKEIGKEKIEFFHHNYSNIKNVLTDTNRFDLILLDLGVSSPQLDEAERGFSFYNEGPLDMRMNRDEEITASDFLQQASAEELIGVFRDLGEISYPDRVVEAIVSDRDDEKKIKFTHTRQLASLIERVDGWSKKGHHPATKYFMALRLKVNKELEHLEEVLPELIELLQNKGRLAVLSFHSLEDRIVKNIFKSSSAGILVNKKVIIASNEEQKYNPRSRSAKLRVFQKEFSK